MMRQELNNQQESDTELSKVATALNLIFQQETKKVSFQKTYQSVYKLCKQGLQSQLFQMVTKSMSNYFNNQINEISLESKDIGVVITNSLTTLIDTIQRVQQILLYLQVNSQNKDKPNSLKTIFNQLLFKLLIGRKQLIEYFVTEITNLKIKGDLTNAKLLVDMVGKIDQNQSFVVDHFLPVYIPSMRKFYSYYSTEVIHSSADYLETYLNWAIQTLKDEQNFFTQITPEKTHSTAIETVMKQLYEVCVTDHKDQIYTKNSKKLFMTLTPKLLELFNMVSPEDVKQHTQWYITIVRNQLSLFPKTHNHQFLECFIKLYNRVSEYLSETTKQFNISYKVKFVFEEWLNEQKLNIAYRLNLYIYTYLQQYSKEKENNNFNIFLRSCEIIFKLLKKKDEFEKEYRKMIIKRNIENIYDQHVEDKLVEIMLKECGNQWVIKINNLKASVHAQNLTCIKTSNAIVFEETSWPFDKENFNALIAPELMVFANEFQKKYLQANKRKKIKWHPTLGTVKMSINYANTRRNVILDTAMATICLFLKKKKGSITIEQFNKQNFFSEEQSREPFKKLLKGQLLIVNNGRLQLNEEFPRIHALSKDFIDLTMQDQLDTFESVDMEELRADRKMMVEAMIVKIMKAAKVANKETIMNKITPVIESRGFKFNQEFVESSIERLLEKQFIRNYNDGNYGYIA